VLGAFLELIVALAGIFTASPCTVSSGKTEIDRSAGFVTALSLKPA